MCRVGNVYNTQSISIAIIIYVEFTQVEFTAVPAMILTKYRVSPAAKEHMHERFARGKYGGQSCSASGLVAEAFQKPTAHNLVMRVHKDPQPINHIQASH
jgi:hypothetical protein